MKTYNLWRALHSLTRRHRWDLRIDGPNDTSVDAAVILVCKPCRISKQVQPPSQSTERCFCRDASCTGWLAYVAHFVDVMGVEPDDTDIAIDQALHVGRDAMVRHYGTSGAPVPFLTALALSEREKR